jgi:hypothetical protein
MGMTFSFVSPQAAPRSAQRAKAVAQLAREQRRLRPRVVPAMAVAAPACNIARRDIAAMGARSPGRSVSICSVIIPS